MNKKALYLLMFLALLPSVLAAKCYKYGKEVPCSELKGVFAAFGIIFVIVIILALLSCVFWIWMLIDCLQREFDEKLVWVLLIVLTGILGAVLYYFIVKRKERRKK